MTYAIYKKGKPIFVSLFEMNTVREMDRYKTETGFSAHYQEIGLVRAIFEKFQMSRSLERSIS